MEYSCNKCGMSVNGIQCAKCNCDLKHSTVDVDGSKVCVCQCPQCDGKIKSPQCCGQDMDHVCD